MTEATIDRAALMRMGTENLQRVIAIDSQSDDRSETIPSTEGQRRLAAYLEGFFRELGFETTMDEQANLLVDVPGAGGPKLCFMVHMDTARGTRALDEVCVAPAWDGSLLRYPDNPPLEVSVARYPQTEAWVGQDVLHGRGDAPIGLDDKLGMSELMTMAEVIGQGGVPHPDMVLVFRPDEEIGRMAAVVGLAGELQRRGVTGGYTVDGITPFEVNVENFNASYAVVRVEGQVMDLLPASDARRLVLRVHGCKSHGATAKAEGYLNATVVLARVFARLGERDDIIPVSFQSDIDAETDAEVAVLVRGNGEVELDAAEQTVLNGIARQLEPHGWRGGGVKLKQRDAVSADAPVTDEVSRALAHVADFIGTAGPTPCLSEDSEGREGYSNPCFIHQEEGAVRVDYRLRDFEADWLTAREEHVRRIASGAGLPVDVSQQYVNMGPRLAPHPELVEWARTAAARVGAEIVEQPIRGGTGVDPFLDVGIPVANLGTGYFAPESEKELTSREMIARHVEWLLALVETTTR